MKINTDKHQNFVISSTYIHLDKPSRSLVWSIQRLITNEKMNHEMWWFLMTSCGFMLRNLCSCQIIWNTPCSLNLCRNHQLWPWSGSLLPNGNIRHMWIQILYSHIKKWDISFNNMLLKPKYQPLSVNINLLSFKRVVNIWKSKLSLIFFFLLFPKSSYSSQLATCNSCKVFSCWSEVHFYKTNKLCLMEEIFVRHQTFSYIL